MGRMAASNPGQSKQQQESKSCNGNNAVRTNKLAWIHAVTNHDGVCLSVPSKRSNELKVQMNKCLLHVADSYMAWLHIFYYSFVFLFNGERGRDRFLFWKKLNYIFKKWKEVRLIKMMVSKNRVWTSGKWPEMQEQQAGLWWKSSVRCVTSNHLTS